MRHILCGFPWLHSSTCNKITSRSNPPCTKFKIHPNAYILSPASYSKQHTFPSCTLSSAEPYQRDLYSLPRKTQSSKFLSPPQVILKIMPLITPTYFSFLFFLLSLSNPPLGSKESWFRRNVEEKIRPKVWRSWYLHCSFSESRRNKSPVPYLPCYSNA